MRLAVICVLALSVGGCVTTSIPDSGAEATGLVGGTSYRHQLEAADASLAGGQPAGAPLSALNTTVVASAPAATEAEALAAQTRAALGAGTAATPTPATNSVIAGARLSDEQNFEAVAGRETIESDRVRLQQNRDQFQQVAPTALPQRPEDTGPNIVAYALATSHPSGQKIYNRSSLFGSRNGRNCNRYSNANEAQEAFLAAGGPQRDRQGLDPDGDGYACGWDPTPFRLAGTASN